MEIKPMANPANNPLFKHFRQPAVYLKLPSGGKFYPDNAIDFPVTGEIPVYPMTVKDELTLRTPDALMNGQGMVDVVKSCCPNIKDPWQMPSVDLDAVFIAIRLASYGPGMDIATTCPSCKEPDEHTINLQSILGNIRTTDYTRPAFAGELKFQFRPQRYQDINKINLINYEEQRLIDSVINNESMSDDLKQSKFQESFAKLKQLNIDSITDCIESITNEDGISVTDKKQIDEFLENCSREVYKEIKDKIQALIDENKMPPMDLTCSHCNHAYKNKLEFDQANFFG